MIKSFIKTAAFASLFLFTAATVNAQDKVKIKDIRKNCVKGSYATCIHLAAKYLKQEPGSFEAHYLLGVAYAGRATEYNDLYNTLEKKHPGTAFVESECVEALDFLKGAYNCSDSSSFYYDKSNPLLGESFIKKNINACKVGMGSCYNEFSDGTTLESAKKMITSEVTRWQKSSEGLRKTHAKITTDLNALKKK